MIGTKRTAGSVLDIKLVARLELKLSGEMVQKAYKIYAGVYNVIIKIIVQRKKLVNEC